jgi:hypothetical protein
MERSEIWGFLPRGETAPYCAEPVIGPRCARTRWPHAGYAKGEGPT